MQWISFERNVALYVGADRVYLRFFGQRAGRFTGFARYKVCPQLLIPTSKNVKKIFQLLVINIIFETAPDIKLLNVLLGVLELLRRNLELFLDRCRFNALHRVLFREG